MSRGPIPLSKSRQKSTGRPKKPIYLKGEAAAEWNRVVAELVRCGLSAPSDRAILEMYCIAYSEVRAATAVLQKEGRYIKTPIQNAAGKVLGETKKPHPLVNAQIKALVVCKSYLDALGLSPVARRRMNPDGPVEDDELSKLIGE